MGNIVHLAPQYRSHKIVQAVPIASCTPHATLAGKHLLEFLDSEKFQTMIINSDMVTRYKPVSGDYYVIYDRGEYASFSPRKNFEEGYSAVDLDPDREITKDSLVQLKAPGSPCMTIISLDGATAECLWFDDYQRLDRAMFPLRMLMHYDPQPDFTPY